MSVYISFSIIYIISLLLGVFVFKKNHNIELEDIFFALIPLLIGCLLIRGVIALNYNVSIELYTGETSILLVQVLAITAMFYILGIKVELRWLYVLLLVTVAIYLILIYVEDNRCSKLTDKLLGGEISLLEHVYYRDKIFERFDIYRDIVRYISVVALDLGYVLQSKKDKSKE